ncbi:MAG: hypothetical protein ACOX6X_02700 [Dethiobacteria bacterium]|jgi:hypothetical protein
MKKKPNKSFFYGVCFFVILISFIFFSNFPSFNKQHKEHLQRGLQQQTVDFDEDEKEGCNDTINCEANKEEYYLGIYADQIAVYEKVPQGDLLLREVLPLKVKEVYYQELQKGVPFFTEEEKNLLLENYTS